MKNKILFNRENNTLTIKDSLLNCTWFQEFGQIQEDILSIVNGTINVSMEECTMVSPTPFLSLLLTLKKVKEENGCVVNVYLPEDSTQEKQKFLNYCSREGFLDIINDISEKKYITTFINSYNVIGNDNFENIYKARIFVLEQQNNDIRGIVDGLLSEINDSNLNIHQNQKLYVNITIRNILQELIDNVDKHAYNEEKKYFALYIRMRYATDMTIRMGKVNNTYGKLSTTTKPDEIYVHKGIEIYFQDIGKGIINSYKEKGKRYPNRPLREIVKDAFFKEDFEDRLNNTPVNGLAFLRRIIQEKNNFFCVYNEYEGTGNFGVNDKKINVNNIHMMDIVGKENMHKISGQIYNFTLFDRDYVKQEEEEDLGELLDIYSRDYKPVKGCVIDLRDGNKIEKIKGLQGSVILFVPQYLTKNIIISMLHNVFENSEGIKKLIISDIADEELILFEFSLTNLFASKIDEKNYLTEIFIITKSLKIKSFKAKDIGLKLVQQKVSFIDFNRNYDYLYRIKVYESQHLAKLLENNSIGRYIITKGDIKWTNGEIIDGFINFDMMSANDLCFDLLFRNLKRFMSIIKNQQLYAIDSVVERVVDAVNISSNEQERRERFGVGSVIVTGLTLQSSDYKGNTIHFFCRGKGTRRPALFFDPVYLYKKTEEDKRKSYVRIGKSSRIKAEDIVEEKEKNSSYLEEKEIYKILHQYAYSSVLCGHLNFEKRHDLVSINLNAIMYDENTKLKSYVENVLAYSLGHYMDELLQPNLYFDTLRDCCLVVYPYNHFTSSVLEKITIRPDYRKYIVGLSPTNITYSGESLEYSECFSAYIKEILHEFREKNSSKPFKVVIFDTLSYSGKTKQEIYEYINSIEEVTPYYVSIIDARVNHYVKQQNTLNYMNINIPLLGKSETCKVCLVLNKLTAFKDNIIDANILTTIENIIKEWKVRDVRNYKEIIKLPNFDRIYAKQIVSYDEKIEYKEDDLYFVNALPLYIFITNRVKKENDYSPMEFVFDKYNTIINNDSMAFIIALFLLEYGESIYHSLEKKMTKFLLAYLKNSKELHVSQFVTIALLSLPDEKLIKMVFEFIKEDSYSVQSTYEGQIVLMYTLNREKIDCHNEKVMFLYNKMKSGNNRLDLYKQFHCQLKNTNGNVHNSPLRSLINGQANIENTRLTLASLSLLEESLKCVELTFDILYEEGRDDTESTSNPEISQIRECCMHDIMEVKKKIVESKDKEGSLHIKNMLNSIFNASQEMHKRLFAPYIISNTAENRKLKTIVTMLAERIDIYNELTEKKEYLPIVFDESYDGKINVSGNIVTIYYIWNNMLIREIDYVLDNVGKFVKRSNSVTIDGQVVAGVVQIKITASEFAISIYNNTIEDINSIKEKAKQRYQKEVLSMLGVRFEYSKNERENSLFREDAVITKIIIPNIQNVKEK